MSTGVEPEGSNSQDGKVLTAEDLRFFNHISQDITANCYQSLVQRERLLLLEVACSPESRLSSTVQSMSGRDDAAMRVSYWNGGDLGSGAGVKHVLGLIDEHHPEHVYISPECGPYSPIQNLNQNTPEQRQELERKRREVLKQYIGASCVYQHCIQQGVHVTWEWSERCQGWRLPFMQKLQQKYRPYMSVVHGCQVNLRNVKGQLMKKGWKLMSTHKRVSEMMNLPCRCGKLFRHGLCEGNETRKTAYYTDEYAKRFYQAIRYEMTQGQILDELNGKTNFCEHFGSGRQCVCEELKRHDTHIQCGACCMKRETETEMTGNDGQVFTGETVKVETKKRALIRKQLYLLHAATGHSSVRNMIMMLQKRGVKPEVLEEAKRFTCSICQEKAKVTPKHVSSLEPLPPKWSVICADGGKWTHPVSQEHVEFAVIIDEGSRFRTAKILSKGRKQTMSAHQFLTYLQEGWAQYFGNPQTLRLDPAGAFRSNEVEAYCDRKSIYLDVVPAEAHWKFGICEQAVQGLKEVMGKLVSEDGEISAEEVLSTAVRTFNQRDVVRGYSPIQHAMGIAPDETGRFVRSLDGRASETLLANPTGDFQQTIERMRVAEQAHSQWIANERIKKAMNSRAQTHRKFYPGDLVYYWRRQVPKSMAAHKGGGYLGPGRILVTETKRDDSGALRPGSAVWLVRGRRLLKCAVEQLRHATHREELLEHLTDLDDKKAPWTLPRMVSELGKHEYEDVTNEVPTETELMEQDEVMGNGGQESGPGPRHRHTAKRPLSPSRGDMDTRQERGNRRSQGSQQQDLLEEDDDLCAEAWWSQVEFPEAQDEAMNYWCDETAAVEIAVEMPTSRRGWESAEADLQSYFVGALRRRACEVSEKRMDAEEKRAFAGAKAAEVKNFIAAKAFECLPPHLQPPREQAVGMRWILTWKVKDDGTTKPKARAILLGYQDPGYEHRATTTPVMTRQSRQMVLQVAAVRRWKTEKGDVSGAFLQGREYPGDLFCIPCDEICKAMDVPVGTITKVKRGCYGLVDAPLEWYRTISSFFAKIGLEKSWSDPCLWLWKPKGVLRGTICGHVDDFLFSGGREDQEWQGLLQKIQKEYNWGEWQSKSFVQCGVLIEEQPDNSYHLSQPDYMTKVKEIPLPATRRKDSKQETNEWEKSQLRGALGALSWHAQQVAPHFSAEVGLLLSEVSTSTVDTILRVNKLIFAARGRKGHKLVIHHFSPKLELGLFMWADAAGQNRRDGSSTQGLFLGIAPIGLLDGNLERITPIAWHANKIDRVARSPGAAEAIAVVNGEDILYHARHQWGEMLGAGTNVFDVDKTVNSITGAVISDSRNVYDRLQTEEFSTKGCEKRTGLELMCLLSIPNGWIMFMSGGFILRLS